MYYKTSKIVQFIGTYLYIYCSTIFEQSLHHWSVSTITRPMQKNHTLKDPYRYVIIISELVLRSFNIDVS